MLPLEVECCFLFLTGVFYRLHPSIVVLADMLLFGWLVLKAPGKEPAA